MKHIATNIKFWYRINDAGINDEQGIVDKELSTIWIGIIRWVKDILYLTHESNKMFTKKKNFIILFIIL
jgi:hypothetical protein